MDQPPHGKQEVKKINQKLREISPKSVSREHPERDFRGRVQRTSRFVDIFPLQGLVESKFCPF